MLGCCESRLNNACLTILSCIAVYNHDTYVQVSSASVINVGISFVMIIINQHLRLEIAKHKFFKNGYGKYRILHSANSVNETENDTANSVNAAENDLTDWQFSVSRALIDIYITYIAKWKLSLFKQGISLQRPN